MVETMTKIAILGGGQIGEALTSGLVASGFAGSDITVTNRTESRSKELQDAYGVATTSDNAAAVDGADYIFACVKPYAILALCVTAIMVGVTHALRTARDGFSMFLAGFTGLVLTFGPLLLVML